MCLTSLSRWRLKGRELLPIVHGGMGVGVSAHRLELRLADTLKGDVK